MKHDPMCAQFSRLAGRVDCTGCLTAIAARAGGWYSARTQIRETAASLEFLTDEQREAIEMVLTIAELNLPDNYFLPLET